MGRGEGKGRQFGRLVVSVIRNFFVDDCYNKASALTFYTLQAIVPILAFLLGAAKGFGLDRYIEQLITRAFHEQKEILDYAIQIARGMLDNLHSSIIVGFGVLFLIYTIVNLIQYIEKAFNDIWRVRSQRGYFQKVSDYIAAFVLCPIIVVISSSITIYVKTQLLQLEENPTFKEISQILLIAFKVLPYLLTWAVFFLLYYLIPNTTKKVWPKVVGALFAGIAFQLWQILYIALQVKVFHYNVVYGAFAVIPLFMIWLQFSWLIALAGAELAAHLEIDNYPTAKHIRPISNRELGLLLIQSSFQSFYSGHKAPTDEDLAKKLKIPLDVTEKMVDMLVKGGILIPLENGGYHPKGDAKHFTLKQVLDLIDSQKDFGVSVEKSKALETIAARLDKLNDAGLASRANVTLDDLIIS